MCCSLCWGWDQSRSTEKSSVGKTAGDAVNSSRPKEIHQVSFQLSNPRWLFFIICLSLCVWNLWFLLHKGFALVLWTVIILRSTSKYPIQSHDKSFIFCSCSHFGYFYVCLSLFTKTSTSIHVQFLFFCLSLSSVHESCHLSFTWSSCFSFYFSLTFPPFFPSFFSLHLTVRSYLRSVPIYYC